MMYANVQGLPGDDWPGVPGADWGMGSRVFARDVRGKLHQGMVVGAHEDGGCWIIHVRLPSGDCGEFPSCDVSSQRVP